jgi:tetratricopeptide (TPR) repeat protein
MLLDLEPIFEQVQASDPVGAAYRLVQLLGVEGDGRAFYEAGSLALARRDELGAGALRFARIVFAEAVERSPELAEAHHDLASTMRELGMSQDAVLHYRRALELVPGDVDSLIGLGAAQCDAGILDEGIATLRRATEEHNDNGHAFANLGVALEGAGRDEEAASAYAKAVARFDAALLDATDDETASEAAIRLRWARIQHAHLLERLERWPHAVVEFRHLYEEERQLAEAEAEAEAHEEDDDDDDDDDDDEGDDEEAGDAGAAERAAVRDAEDSGEGDGELLDDGARVPRHETGTVFGPDGSTDADADGPDGSLTGVRGLGEDEDDDDDDDDEGSEDGLPEDAGRLGLERLFARLIQLRRIDLAYLVLDDLGGELADDRTRATYAIYDPGDGLPQIMVEHWDGGAREQLDPGRPS